MRHRAVDVEDPPVSSNRQAPLQPTCMIVEDNAPIRLALEACLEQISFGACETFASSGEALAWLGSCTPAVAILDFGLRDGPCTSLARALRERGVPFVIYSGRGRDAASPDLWDVPWLSKPCNRAALLAALTRAAPAGERFLGDVGRRPDPLLAAIAGATPDRGERADIVKVSMSRNSGMSYVLRQLPAFRDRDPRLRADWQLENRQVVLLAEGCDAATGGEFDLSRFASRLREGFAGSSGAFP